MGEMMRRSLRARPHQKSGMSASLGIPHLNLVPLPHRLLAFSTTVAACVHEVTAGSYVKLGLTGNGSLEHRSLRESTVATRPLSASITFVPLSPVLSFSMSSSTPASPASFARPQRLDTNAENRGSGLRASILESALELGLGSNRTVANWMFNPVEEVDEENDTEVRVGLRAMS